jgi:hypothetical protein
MLILSKKLIPLAILLCSKTRITIYYNNIITTLPFCHFILSLCFEGKVVFLPWYKCLLRIVQGYSGKYIL